MKLEKTYEYIRLLFDISDLGPMNRLASTGWRVVAVVPDGSNLYALMERPL